MSLKLWRKLRSAYRIAHYSRKRPQVLPGRHLRKKQKKFFRYNRKFYSGEIASPISKYTIWQLRNKFLTNSKLSTSSSILPNNLSLFWKFPFPLMGKAESLESIQSRKMNFEENKRSTFIINKERSALFIFRKTPETLSMHNIKQKSSLIRIDFVHHWQAKEVFCSIRQLKVNLATLPWFFHNPSPIPGVFKLRRLNSNYLKEIQSNHNLSLYLGGLRQQILLCLWNSCFFSSKDTSLWLIVQALERYWPLLLTKTGFVQGIFSRKQRVQHSKFLLNGQTILKVWRIAYPGDILVIKSINLKFYLRKKAPLYF
jgi:hypothetical protein